MTHYFQVTFASFHLRKLGGECLTSLRPSRSSYAFAPACIDQNWHRCNAVVCVRQAVLGCVHLGHSADDNCGCEDRQKRMQMPTALRRAVLLGAADRDYLSLTQQDFQSVPVYIVAQTLVAFVLGLWGESSFLHKDMFSTLTPTQLAYLVQGLVFEIIQVSRSTCLADSSLRISASQELRHHMQGCVVDS